MNTVDLTKIRFFYIKMNWETWISPLEIIPFMNNKWKQDFEF